MFFNFFENTVQILNKLIKKSAGKYSLIYRTVIFTNRIAIPCFTKKHLCHL